MVMSFLKWIKELFVEPPPPRGFCYWCHKDPCPFPTFEACRDHRFQCQYHPEVKDGSPPSFCHSCSYGWEPKKQWVKPTIYKPHGNWADSRWCLDWICEKCDRRNIEQEDLWRRQKQNTIVGAQLSFTKNNDEFFFYENPIKADFPLTYESLVPFVTRIHNITASSLCGGIDWEYISIRDNIVYIHDGLREYPEWNEEEDV